MDFFPQYEQEKFSDFVSQIRKEVDDWQVIEVNLTGSHDAPTIALKLCTHFQDKDGLTLIVNKKTILVLVALGRHANLQLIAMGIRAKMPPDSCTVIASGMTGDGLARLQLQMHDEGKGPGSEDAGNDMLAERMGREERVILVVDNDPHARKAIDMAYRDNAHIIEQTEAAGLADVYRELLPDIVFLNLDLPGNAGKDLLGEILDTDKSAFVIVTAFDETKSNVAAATISGAQEIVVKPLSPQKLRDIYQKCPTTAPRK